MQRMEDAYALALHAKRVTLMPPDLKLARYLRGDSGTPCVHMPKFVAKGKMVMPGDLTANPFTIANGLDEFHHDLKRWPEQTKQLYRALNNKEAVKNELRALNQKKAACIKKHKNIVAWIATETARAQPSPGTCHFTSPLFSYCKPS